MRNSPVFHVKIIPLPYLNIMKPSAIYNIINYNPLNCFYALDILGISLKKSDIQAISLYVFNINCKHLL